MYHSNIHVGGANDRPMCAWDLARWPHSDQQLTQQRTPSAANVARRPFKSQMTTISSPVTALRHRGRGLP
eukprot:COSAG06_NODE_61345_length_268_cov_0.597633_1_plen_69_part_01